MRHSPAGSVTPSHVVETDAEEIERKARQIFESKVDDAAEMEEFPEEAAAAEAEAEAEAEEHHLVHLLHAKGRPMEPGSELTLRTAPPAVARYNDQLLLEAGFLWDDLACASVPLRFQIGVDSMP